MTYPYDLVVYIGRFQPKHKIHHRNTLQALQEGRHVLICIGSAHEAPRVDNPFTYAERVAQFKVGFGATDLKRLTFCPIEDWLYVYTRWLRSVKTAAYACCDEHNLDKQKIALIGYDKDNTSFYVHDFPEWDFLHVEGVPNMSSTDVREFWYHLGEFRSHPHLLPASNEYFREQAAQFAERFVQLRMLFERYRVTPYGPISMAVDALVLKEQQSVLHVLLVRRKDDKTLALPGGFLERSETLLTGARRELREETGLDLTTFAPTHVSRVFDDPKRSQKGRVLTQVFVWDLDRITKWDQGLLPTVTGADDALEALWMPVKSLRRDKMHDDHYQIIDYLLEQLARNKSRHP